MLYLRLIAHAADRRQVQRIQGLATRSAGAKMISSARSTSITEETRRAASAPRAAKVEAPSRSRNRPRASCSAHATRTPANNHRREHGAEPALGLPWLRRPRGTLWRATGVAAQRRD